MRESMAASEVPCMMTPSGGEGMRCRLLSTHCMYVTADVFAQELAIVCQLMLWMMGETAVTAAAAAYVAYVSHRLS